MSKLPELSKCYYTSYWYKEVSGARKIATNPLSVTGFSEIVAKRATDLIFYISDERDET